MRRVGRKITHALVWPGVAWLVSAGAESLAHHEVEFPPAEATRAVMMPLWAPINSSLADRQRSETTFVTIYLELNVSVPDLYRSPHDVLWNIESDFVLAHCEDILDP